jgi:integrase
LDILSLSDARDKSAEGRKMAKAGLDPSIEWRRSRETIPTFKVAAGRCHDDLKPGWKNPKHAAQWLSTLETYVYPTLGSKRVDHIDGPMVLEVLLPIWLTIPQTARRVRQRIGAVLDYAHAKRWRTAEAPLRAIGKGLPKQNSKGDRHFAAMPYPQLPAFMTKVGEQEQSVGRLALQFTILTAARSGEVRGATWKEFDLDAALWSIPGTRMKGGKPHTVPLSGSALVILKEMAGLVTGRKGEHVFPGTGEKKPLSDMTLTKALKSAAGSAYTVHGFRSSFRDWCAEMMPSVPAAVAETALAHSIPNKVEAAYRRTMFLDQRRTLMKSWAEFLAGESNVVRLAAG